MKHLLAATAVLALAACSQPAEQKAAAPAAPAAPATPAAATVDPAQPAGAYLIDPTHSTVTFRADHLGFSKYVMSFGKVDATLQLDPKAPEAAQVTVTIDPRSLILPNPPAGFKDELLGPNWLDAGRCPQITFRSSKVTRTGPDTADVAGDLTIKCATKPAVLKTKFNGGYPPNALDPGGARVGFSAATVIKRSDFGVSYGIPAPGSNMGVFDDVEVAIETEFSRAVPAAAPAPQAP